MEKDYSHRPGFIARGTQRVLGVNGARAEWAGRDDQAQFGLLGVALALLMGWIGFAAAVAASYATHQPILSAMPLLFAGFVAGIYGVVDLPLSRGHIWAVGRKLARQRGFGLVESRAQPVLRFFGGLPFAFMRLALAISVALFAGGTFVLWWWQDDISAKLVADQVEANARLQGRIGAELDLDLASVTGELKGIEERIAARADDATRQAINIAKAAAVTRTTLQGRLDDLTQKIAATEDAIACMTRTLTAEEKGLMTCEGQIVTLEGKGKRYRMAEGELQLLEAEKARLVAEATDLSAALSDLPVAPTFAVDPESERRDDLRATRARMLSDRADVVQDRMKADPSFVPLAEGLLARQGALEAMSATSPALRNQIVVVKVMFVLFDLAVLLIVFGRTPDSLYAVAQVVEFETRTAELIAHGRLAMAEANSRGLASEVTELEAQLQRAQAKRKLQDELRQMDVSAAMLERYARDIARDLPPHFDA